MSKPVIFCFDEEKMVLDSLRGQSILGFGNNYIYYQGAEDAEEALEVVSELNEEVASVVLIISDWLVPGVKGDEFLIQIHDNSPDVVKNLLASQADPGAIERAKTQANIHKCLYNYWSEADLLETIKAGLYQL